MAIAAPADTAAAMNMVLTGLRHLAAADPAVLAARAQAECLQAFEQGDAMSTAARARVLAAFTSGRIGRPLYSGTSGAHTSQVMSPARRLPPSNGTGPTTPVLLSPTRSSTFTEHQPRVHGLPLTCGSPDDTASPRLSPGLRTHASRTRARTPGQGQALSTSQELRPRHLPHAEPPIREFTRTCATLVSHHHQVAIHQWGWTVALHPDGTKTFHSHSPPTTRAG